MIRVPTPDGAQLACSIEGDGPDLLLVHAGVADRRMWDPLVALVGNRFRVIRYDGRGAGETVSPAGEFSPHQDLLAVVVAARIEHATLVGSSFGGFVALEAALVRPAAFAKLVLLDPPLFDHEWSPRMEDFDAAETAAFEAGDLDAAVELNVDLWTTPASAELVRTMQRRAFEVQHEAPVDPQELRPPVWERLREIALPTTVAYGAEDVEDFRTIAKRLAAEISGAELVEIPGAGHLPPLDRPDAVAALLSRII